MQGFIRVAMALAALGAALLGTVATATAGQEHATFSVLNATTEQIHFVRIKHAITGTGESPDQDSDFGAIPPGSQSPVTRFSYYTLVTTDNWRFRAKIGSVVYKTWLSDTREFFVCDFSILDANQHFFWVIEPSGSGFQVRLRHRTGLCVAEMRPERPRRAR